MNIEMGGHGVARGAGDDRFYVIIGGFWIPCTVQDYVEARRRFGWPDEV